MYDPENNGQESTGDSSQIDSGRVNASSDSTPAPAELQAKAVIINCPYCRKKFDRASTKSMPFCSPRCKQIDLGLWLNEVHGMPYEIDPGIS